MTTDLTEIKDTGFTEEEQKKVTKFIQAGVPGITKITEQEIFKAFELYSAGKTFSEIASAMKIKTEIVLYLAAKTQWHLKRKEYYEALINNFAEKQKMLKIETINTVSGLIMLMNKHYSKRINTGLINGDLSELNDKDFKMLQNFFKAIETLSKLIGDTSAKAPTIHVHGDAEINSNSNSNIKDEDLSKVLNFLAQNNDKK
jgi:hypothetical protein